VGVLLEIGQLVFLVAAAPFTLLCDIGNDYRSQSYPSERKECGPQHSPVPLLIALGGAGLAIGGGAMRSDATSPEERAALARGYNLRLRESAGRPQPASPPVTLGVSAAALPSGGMLLLGGRF